MRKVQSTEIDRVRAYVKQEPEVNLFILGDIEQQGVDSEIVEIFVEDKGDDYAFLLLRYLESYVIYSADPGYDAGRIAAFLKEREVNVISGKDSVVERLVPYFPERFAKKTYLAKLDSVLWRPDLPAGFTLRRLAVKDAAELVRFYGGISEFASSYRGREEKAVREQEIALTNGGRIWGVLNSDGRLVSVAAATAEYSESAMVVGVATEVASRGRGLASAIVAGLCSELLQSGKRYVCLFYDNPQAGRIYRKIGFTEIGGYTMITRTEDDD